MSFLVSIFSQNNANAQQINQILDRTNISNAVTPLGNSSGNGSGNNSSQSANCTRIMVQIQFPPSGFTFVK